MKQLLSIGLTVLTIIGCSGGGGGGGATSATPPSSGDPGDLSVTSNQLISSYVTDMCTEFANEVCYFDGGQVVKYSDGSIVLMGTYVFAYSVAGDSDTDQNTATIVIPSSQSGAYVRLSRFVARGGGYKPLYLVYQKSPETVGLKLDTDSDGVLEASDETITTLSLSSW